MPRPTEITTDAPGKVLLFGEHAVVYGEPALGFTLSRGARVTLAPGTGKVEVAPVPGREVEPSRGAATPEALVARALGPLAGEVDVLLRLDFPPMSGFGSSAALAVALIAAAEAWRAAAATRPAPVLDFDQRLARALEVEEVAHSRPSGVDPAIILHGGLTLFTRRDGGGTVRSVHVPAPVHLVVGAAGRHGGTGQTVSQIAELREAAPELMRAAMAALGECARTGAGALERGELGLAGRALDLAHGALAGLGLVSPQVAAAVELARRAGALGAKMSGAGGEGGAFVALYAGAAAAEAAAATLEASGARAWVERLASGR